MIDIGIGKKWSGLGDLICMVLPLLNADANKFRLILHNKVAKYEQLFTGYNVVVDDSLLPENGMNLNLDLCIQQKLLAEQTLKSYGYEFNEKPPLFKINEVVNLGKSVLKRESKSQFQKEAILVTNPSKGATDRTLDYDFWKNLVETNHNVLFHHFRLDYHYNLENVENVIEYNNIPIIDVARAYSEIDFYIGPNTGDYHLALAMGMQPEHTIVITSKKDRDYRRWIYSGTELAVI